MIRLPNPASFVYRGPVPDDDHSREREVPLWIERIFHGFMMILLFSVIFSLSGCFLFLQGARSMGISETPATAWIRFGLGGLLGCGFFVYLMKRRLSPRE